MKAHTDVVTVVCKVSGRNYALDSPPHSADCTHLIFMALQALAHIRTPFLRSVWLALEYRLGHESPGLPVHDFGDLSNFRGAT